MLEKQKQRNKVEKVIFQFDETTKKESLIKQKNVKLSWVDKTNRHILIHWIYINLWICVNVRGICSVRTGRKHEVNKYDRDEYERKREHNVNKNTS